MKIAVIEQIRGASPDILFVARGADNQEPWIAQHKQALQVPVVMGSGIFRYYLRQTEAGAESIPKASSRMVLPPSEGAHPLQRMLAEIRSESLCARKRNEIELNGSFLWGNPGFHRKLVLVLDPKGV